MKTTQHDLSSCFFLQYFSWIKHTGDLKKNVKLGSIPPIVQTEFLSETVKYYTNIQTFEPT